MRGVHLQCHIGTDTRLAAPARRADDRPGLLRRRRCRRPAPLAERTGAAVDFVEADVYDAPRGARAAAASTWSSPASARCAGCRTSAAGPAWSPTCCAPAGGCSSARGTRCCGPSTTPAPDGLLVVELPVLRAAEPMVWDEAGTYVETDGDLQAHTSRTSGTTGSARSSPRCSTTGWTSPGWSSTTAYPGTRCPANGPRRARRVAAGRPALAAGADLHPAGPAPGLTRAQSAHLSTTGSSGSCMPSTMSARSRGRASARYSSCPGRYRSR